MHVTARTELIVEALAKYCQPLSRRQLADMLNVPPNNLETAINRLLGGASSRQKPQPRRIHVAGWMQDENSGGRWCRLFAIGGDKQDVPHPNRERQYDVSKRWQYPTAAPQDDAVSIAKRNLGNPFAGLIK